MLKYVIFYVVQRTVLSRQRSKKTEALKKEEKDKMPYFKRLTGLKSQRILIYKLI